jgi:AcrR family transcriptional regulator
MLQHERSERSRALILEAALRLFSQQGYRATSIRDIAEAAGVSTGNLYHQFPDKETIFRQLLDQYWQALADPKYPVNRALAQGAFPHHLEELGRAVRESVRRYRPYVALIYVDVIEFEGSHIRRFYSDMAERFARFLDAHAETLELDKHLRPEVSPVSAVMLATRLMFYYFAVELVFGVPNQFGRGNDEVLREIADILQRGMLRPESVGAMRKKPLPATRATVKPRKAVARRARPQGAR